MTFKPINKPVHPLPSFRFGLNNQQSPDEIADFEMSDCENVSVEEDSVISAQGYDRWDDDYLTNPGPFWGGVTFNKTTNPLDIRQRRGTLEYAVDGGTTWVTCTLPTAGSPAATVVLTQKPCVFAQLNDTLLWTNGTDTVMSSTDGITWTLRPSLPICDVIFENAKNRVLFMGLTATPYTFWWSAINDPLTIGSDSYQLIDPNNHGAIKGAALAPDGTTLVFKESALYSVADFVDDGIIDLNFLGKITLQSHHTIATTENSVIWAGYAGIYEYIGGQVINIAGRISWSGRNAVSRNDLYCGVYANKRYHLSMPDADISQDYNSQEYIVYKTLLRQDAMQPYVITRNRRYFGMYYVSDYDYTTGRDISIMAGDSRPMTTSGSPAQYDNTVFAFVNDYREADYASNLDGEAQSCWYVTKYLTENVPYYVKRYKKLFSNFKVVNDLTVTLSYRFLPYGEWTNVQYSMTADSLDMIYEDGTEGGFNEGYSFAFDTLGNVFIDIENTERPKGIQFKASWNQATDVQQYGMAFQYRLKPKFKG